MAEYATSAEVKKRATANGWRYLADRDRDGIVSTAEQGEVDYAIAWAGRRIDTAIFPRIRPADARGQGSDYLRDICIDLAIWRLFSNGGDRVPDSVQVAYEDAKEELARIKGGEAVPGLTMVYPLPSVVTAKVPRAYMPR